MKQTLLAVALSAALVSPMVSAVELKTEEQKTSYAIGLQIGLQLQGVKNVDFDVLSEAIQTTYNEKEPLMTPAEVGQTLENLQKSIQEEQRMAAQKLATDNLEKGKTYLAENGKKEGVTTTESGLQYQVLTAGSGEKPVATDTVKVHYKGTLIDGTEFDSSFSRNEPVSFPLNGVIPGWTEGVQLMKTGEKARFVIPSDLAYGVGGTGPNSPIGPNETLVFEIELLEINPSAKPEAEAK